MFCNHVISPLLLSVLLLSLSARAGMVVYTDHAHPPSGVTGDTRVVWLDAPEQLQQSLFGSLTSDPREAERRAQAVIHSAGWQQKQAELAQAYSALKVICTVRVKKACVRCDCIVEAPAPSRPIDRGIAGPGSAGTGVNREIL